MQNFGGQVKCSMGNVEVAYLSHSCHLGHPSHLSHPIVIPAAPVTPAILVTLVTLGTLVFPVILVSTSTPIIFVIPVTSVIEISFCVTQFTLFTLVPLLTLPIPVAVYRLGVRIHESEIWESFEWYF